MNKDEHAIRALVERWVEASMAGDLETVLGLMDEDVLYMVPGREPFAREEFIAGFEATKRTSRLEIDHEIHELRVLGDWAYARNHLNVTVIPHGGGTVHKQSGFTLAIFRKDSHGNWLLHRDANLLTAAQ